jgi:hypothetical protein
MLPLKNAPRALVFARKSGPRQAPKAGIPTKFPDYGVFLPETGVSRPPSNRGRSPRQAFALALRLAAVGGEIRGRQAMAEFRMANLAVARGFDQGPRLSVGEQGLEH